MPRKPRFPDYPGINKFYHDRHGRPRFYVDGIAIKARPFNSPAFRDEYERALLSTEDKPAPKLGTIHGSFRWVCERYIKANENPTTPTQHERRLRLESMWLEPWTPGDSRVFGDFPANKFEAKHVRVLMQRKGRTYAAKRRLSDLRIVFEWAIKNDLLSIEDPTAKVDKLKIKAGGYHPWTDEEREAYCARHPLGTMARTCYEFFWHFGQRISDTAKFGSHNVNDGHLCFTQQNTGKYLELWIPPEIESIIAATKEGVFLRTPTGKPFTRATLGNRMRQWCDEAGLKHCSAHGLRHAAASYYASQPETTIIELCDMFGFTPRTAETYMRKRKQPENARRLQMRVRGMAA